MAARGTGFDASTTAGDLLSLAAVICWAGYTLGLRALPQGISPLRVTMVTTVAGAPALLGAELTERGLRFGLERSYRVLARLAQQGSTRIELVERANRFRPRTWV